MPVKPEYKLTLLGAGGVGKSALTLRIISGVFTPTYSPTIEDYYRHDTNIEGVGPCIVEILDTAGTEQFASMRQLYITSAQAFALVYSIDDRASFEEAQELYRNIKELKSPDQVAIILIGNKCDLHDRRVVDYKEGQQAAREMHGCPFMETSAKDGTNIFEFFSALVAGLDSRMKASLSNHVVRRGSRGMTSLRSLAKRKSRSRSQPDLSNFSTELYKIPAVVADEQSNHDMDDKKAKCLIM